MSRRLIAQLKELRREEVNPSSEWTRKNRELLLTQIRNTMPAGQASERGLAKINIRDRLSLFFPSSIIYNAVRPAVVLLLIFSLGAGGWIATVDASYNALPGDWLYSTKRAAEKTQMAIASAVGDKTAETKLHAEFAKRRAMETKKVTASADPAKMARVGELVSDLNKEMRAVNSKLDQTKNEPSRSMSADAIKTVRKNSEQIKNDLKEAKDNLLATPAVSSTVAKEVILARVMAGDTAIKAVEAMAAKHLQGDQGVSREEVRDAISNQLQYTASEAAEVRQNTQEVRTVVNAVQSEARVMARENRSAAFTAIATTTEALANRVNEAAQRTEAATEEVNRQVRSAEEMLVSGNIAQAMNMARQVNETARQAEVISENTLQAVQIVLPVVSVVRGAELPVASSSAPSVSVVVTTTAITTNATGTTRAPLVVLIVTTTPSPGASTSKK